MKKLEDQAVDMLESDEGMSEKSRNYIIDAVKHIKVQKGIKLSGATGKLKPTKVSEYEKKEYCCPRKTIGQDNKDQKQEGYS